MTLYKGSHSVFRVLAPHYRLNKAEFIQIYNLRPTTQVMLELIIEEVAAPILSLHTLHPFTVLLLSFTSLPPSISLHLLSLSTFYLSPPRHLDIQPRSLSKSLYTNTSTGGPAIL